MNLHRRKIQKTFPNNSNHPKFHQKALLKSWSHFASWRITGIYTRKGSNFPWDTLFGFVSVRWSVVALFLGPRLRTGINVLDRPSERGGKKRKKRSPCGFSQFDLHGAKIQFLHFFGFCVILHKFPSGFTL